jgi:hypothetical protein
VPLPLRAAGITKIVPTIKSRAPIARKRKIIFFNQSFEKRELGSDLF